MPDEEIRRVPIVPQGKDPNILEKGGGLGRPASWPSAPQHVVDNIVPSGTPQSSPQPAQQIPSADKQSS